MKPELSWLIGLQIAAVEKKDFTWFFRFGDSSIIATEAFWRFVTDRVIVTSEDDGQMFGLKSPVNATAVVKERIDKSHVERFTLDERTGDLSLEFTAGGMLQFLTNSSGYEGWRIEHGDQSIICLGGGALAIFGRT